MSQLPDARDGLTPLSRLILVCLAELETERGGAVPTAMLYGRVAQRIDVSTAAFQRELSILGVSARVI